MKPMLSATCTDINALTYPCMASPKLDGIRALVLDGVLVSRNLKPIRNAFTSTRFSLKNLEGLDGELILGDHDASVFRRTTSAVSTIMGRPDITFHVFDVFNITAGYKDRYRYLQEVAWPEGVKIVPHVQIDTPQALRHYEETALAAGYEGIMIRGMHHGYKQGRATPSEGSLYKLKRFEDAEAEIIGVEERLHNGNAATVNALGHTERSHHQANFTGRGDLGALIVRGLNGPYTGAVFNIGTGFDDSDRQQLWDYRGSLPGKQVKYKFFPTGSKDAPRFPVYLGMRMAGT